MTRGEFAEAVFAYCQITRASTTSSIRTLEHNAKVGGVAESAHIFGLGADVVYDTLPMPPLGIALAKRLGLRLIREGDHDHLQPLDWVA